MALRSGIAALDRLLDVDGGIITLRAQDTSWLFFLAASIIVRRHALCETENRKPKTLYLHWVDYYRRYWSLDHDLLARIARQHGADFHSLSRDLYFVRAFTRDNAEVEENWRMISGFARSFGLAVLDSVSELYEERNKRRVNGKTFAYAVGRFARICMSNDCHGLVLDHSSRPIHTYLGELSSAIIEFGSGGPVTARLLKHPCLPEKTIALRFGSQRTLGGWLG